MRQFQIHLHIRYLRAQSLGVEFRTLDKGTRVTKMFKSLRIIFKITWNVLDENTIIRQAKDFGRNRKAYPIIHR